MAYFRPLQILVLYLALCFSAATAQSIKVDALLKKFDSFRQGNLQEKIYAHLDRSSYIAGETIWFKIYLVHASSHKPLDISSVAYVELINRNNSALVQLKIKMVDGAGNGYIKIPATIDSDKYVVRVYTNWMKNSEAEFFFTKSIDIINPFKTTITQKKVDREALEVNFFPEGGNLVANLKNKVAFRVTGPEGKGIDFKGLIVNQAGDTIVHFKPFRFGIGNFTLTPQFNQDYKAILIDESKRTQTINLPKVLDKGFTLQVKDTLNKVHVSVKTNLEKALGVYLFVHARNIISDATFQTLEDGSTTFILNLEDMIDGISHITIFDEKMLPICERLYFKQPNVLSVELNLDNLKSELRRKLKVGLQTTANNGPTKADLSVSIFKIDSIMSKTESIENYFLLTSDLKGQIESPSFYFLPENDSKIAADNLMLTHGWRRFKWDNILYQELPMFTFLPEENGHIIKCSVNNLDNTTSKPNNYLTVAGKNAQLYVAKGDVNNNLYFEMRDFRGPSKLILQSNKYNDSTVQYNIESPFSNHSINYSVPTLKINQEISSSLLDRSVALQVQNIFTNDIVEKYVASEDSIPFYGKADEEYLLDEYTRFPVMEDILREYVRGVLVQKRNDGFHIKLLDRENKSIFTESPLILLDGIPVYDENAIMEFNPREIKKLEVVTRRWHLGSTTFYGIVNFSTYKRDFGSFKLNPKMITIDYDGLQVQREFYSPQYENQSQRESRIPDQRHLLLWNPSITTNEKGEGEFEFYTSDVPGQYVIVVEGINKTGKMGSSKATFTVK